jgi:hypothetical protein
VYAQADGSGGFFARSVRNLDTWEHSWGPIMIPACVPQGLSLWQVPMTLRLWRDLDSVVAFS